MNDLLNIPNSDDKKIQNSIKYAIKNKKDEIKKINNDINSMINQSKNNKIYTNNSTNDKTSVRYVGLAITTIISDILSGFIEAIEEVRENSKKFGLNKQKYGDSLDKNSNILLNSATTARKRINKLSDKMMKGGLGGEVLNKVYDKTRYDTNKIDKTDLIPLEVMSKIKDIGEASIKTGIKWSGDFINGILNMGLDLTGESKLLQTPIDELSPKLNKKIILFAEVLRELSSNPSTRIAIKKIAESITITAVELLEEMRPALRLITDESLDILHEVGENYARGITDTGISMGQAFIAEIPWFGGIIDLVLALGKGFNVIMQVYEVIIYRGGPLFVDTTKIVHDIKGISKRGNIRIDTALKNYFDARDDKINTQPDRQVGGEYINNIYTPCKKTYRKITMGGKRIRKTMKLFQSTLPKIKFSSSSFRKKTRKRLY